MRQIGDKQVKQENQQKTQQVPTDKPVNPV